jgi:hypothetical protein
MKTVNSTPSLFLFTLMMLRSREKARKTQIQMIGGLWELTKKPGYGKAMLIDDGDGDGDGDGGSSKRQEETVGGRAVDLGFRV